MTLGSGEARWWSNDTMKPREIIILLLAAAFGAIAIVTWSGEEEAKAQAAKFKQQAEEVTAKAKADQE